MKNGSLSLRLSVLSSAMLGLSGVARADVVPLGEFYSVESMNGAGDVFSGSIYDQDTTHSEAYVWVDGAPTALGTLSGYDDSFSQGVSDDGSVVVGINTRIGPGFTYQSQAFAWTSAGGMVALDPLANGASTYANGVSADGNVIVGQAYLTSGGSNGHAVIWTGANRTLQDLTTGSVGLEIGANENSFANAASTDGSVVVGGAAMAIDGKQKAFRWTSGTGMVSLGTLVGDVSSQAKAVSSDGAVVAGGSYSGAGDIRAFRWTQGGGMTDLGHLSGMSSTQAYGINADGSVIVGYSATSGFTSQEAFRWSQSGGMQSVAAWLSGNGISVGSGDQLRNAYDVSDDGNIVLGTGVIDGINQPFVARIAGTTNWSGGGSGIIGMTSYTQTLAGVGGAVSGMGPSVVGMTLYGAHHRLLVDNGLASGKCMWVTGDLGTNDGSDSENAIGEAGVCADFGENRIGIGLGVSSVNQDLIHDGDASYDGKHLVVEIDHRLPNPDMVASLTGFYGVWDADLDRHYQNGASIDSSRGESDADAWALRARLDYYDMAQWGRFSLSPFVSYTHQRSHVDGYSETGGGFPVTYDAYASTLQEFRIGAVGKTALSSATDVMASLEGIHTEDSGGTLTGTVIGIGAFTPQTAGRQSRDQARVGLEIDHRLDKGLLLNASAHAAAGDGDNVFSVSLGLRYGF